MANNCEYICRIASRNRESVRQFVDAMMYRDMKNGYYMCRIFSAYPSEFSNANSGGTTQIVCDDDGVYYAEVSGDCAWSVKSCMITNDYGEWRGMDYGNPKFSVFRDYDGSICYANIGMTAGMLCKELGCGFEVWSRESGICFQEHFVVNSNGKVVVSDCVNWEEGYDTDDNGDYIEPNPEKDTGGFDDWGDFMDAYDMIVAE